MTINNDPSQANSLSAIPTMTAADWARGWRYKTIIHPDGRRDVINVPIDPDEVVHPKDVYIAPVSTFHERICSTICGILRWRYVDQPTMAVYRDLIFDWDVPGLKSHAPDVALTPNVRDRDADRGRFDVAAEGTRPILVIEIVSPVSREGDRVIKVKEYARAGIQEYVFLERRVVRNRVVSELAGYRLEDGQYVPMLPDEDDALYCQTVNLRIGFDGENVWLEDGETGEDLLTNLQARRALEGARALAEQEAMRAEHEAARAEQEAEARRLAEMRIAELEAQLRRLQENGQ